MASQICPNPKMVISKVIHCTNNTHFPSVLWLLISKMSCCHRLTEVPSYSAQNCSSFQWGLSRVPILLLLIILKPIPLEMAKPTCLVTWLSFNASSMLGLQMATKWKLLRTPLFPGQLFHLTS